jgi:hypothetical protein
MKARHLLSLFAGCAALLLAGCSTPDTRIRANPEVFNRLSAEEQDLIREGRVAIGFDQEMVRLAVGDPDRVWTRTDQDGASESWSYTTYETHDGFPLYRGFYHRYYHPYYGGLRSRYYGGFAHGYYPYYLSYPGRQDREVFKVLFKDGRVVAIEQESRA